MALGGQQAKQIRAQRHMGSNGAHGIQMGHMELNGDCWAGTHEIEWRLMGTHEIELGLGEGDRWDQMLDTHGIE